MTEAEREYQRNYYRKHREKLRAKQVAWRAAHRQHSRDYQSAYARVARREHPETFYAARQSRIALLKAFADSERVRGCVDCGEKDMGVIDFDHVRGTKVHDVSKMIARSVSVRRLLAEIDKCEPRCANCHRRVTDSRRRAA